MLQDYPLYEEMVRLGSRGRWVWRIGNWLVYTGVIGIIFLLIIWPVVFYFKISDAGLIFLVALFIMAALFTLGSLLKRLSYRIALGEGIDVVKFLTVEEDGKPGSRS
ncbi:MAG TPA: hypothetical protein DEQ38_06495 [Elusimicrobia bacterium]|nr:MAG: hypothetical protein A2089_08960 [Elusimicrobia bacterium GWD2_63_28]HCC47751.1 hypothetical protein [Elusimicrobiota bacterium]